MIQKVLGSSSLLSQRTRAEDHSGILRLAAVLSLLAPKILDFFPDLTLIYYLSITYQTLVKTLDRGTQRLGTVYGNIDARKVFFAIVNWPNSELYGASVCIMYYFDLSATNQLDNVFLIVGCGFL